MTDLVDIAVNTEGFSTLVTAVKAANLVEALKSPGPFTVFAPIFNLLLLLIASISNSIDSTITIFC